MVNSENVYWSVRTLLVVDSINLVKPNQSLWKIATQKLFKKNNNNTFTIHTISIFFKVFKNLCLNENDETLFLKKMHINYSCKMNLEKILLELLKV